MDFTSTPDDGVTEDNPLAGLSITLDGEVFPCDGELSLLETSDLAATAIRGSEIADAAQAAAVAFTLEQAFGPEVYARFRQHCRGAPAQGKTPARPRTPNRVILAILQEINEAIQSATEEMTGRPTSSPGSSSPGETGQDDRISRIVSFQRGEVTIIPPEGQEAGPGNPAAGKEPASAKVMKGCSSCTCETRAMPPIAMPAFQAKNPIHCENSAT